MSDESGGSGDGVRPGRVGRCPLPQSRLLASVQPTAPIEIDVRGNLTAALFDQAVRLAPRHCSMALAVAYVVFPVREEPPARSHAHHPNRVGVFVRWGIGFDPDAQAAPMLERRASKHIRQACDDASDMLCQYYHLEPQASGELDSRLQAEIADQRVVELPFRRWGADSGWLAPMQLQLILDRLLCQPRFAAIQFSVALCSTSAAPVGQDDRGDQEDARDARVGQDDRDDREDARDARDAWEERQASAGIGAPRGASSASGCFHVQVAALGAATHHDALWLLAKELCGRGALVIPRADRPQPPGVRATPPTDQDDHLRIARNLLGPAAETSNLTERIAYTRDEAVTLFPLPFKAQ